MSFPPPKDGSFPVLAVFGSEQEGLEVMVHDETIPTARVAGIMMAMIARVVVDAVRKAKGLPEGLTEQMEAEATEGFLANMASPQEHANTRKVNTKDVNEDLEGTRVILERVAAELVTEADRDRAREILNSPTNPF